MMNWLVRSVRGQRRQPAAQRRSFQRWARKPLFGPRNGWRLRGEQLGHSAPLRRAVGTAAAAHRGHCRGTSGRHPKPRAGFRPGSAASLPIQVEGSAAGLATPNSLGFSPAQIQNAYGFNQIPGLTDGNYNDAGRTQTIAIVLWGNNPNIRSDVEQFDESYNIGGSTGDPTDTSFLCVVNQSGSSTELPTDNPAGSPVSIEAALDVESAHAMAPGAKILFVEANSNNPADTQTAVMYAAQQPNVSVVSMSYGGGEGSNDLTWNTAYTTPPEHELNGTLEGVAFVAASGDYGAPPVYPSSSPNVLAVGGTVLTINPDGSTSQAGWVGSGGGISIEEQPSYQEGVVSQSANNRATPDVAYASAGVNTSKIGVNTYYSVGVGFNVYNSYSPTPGWIMVGGTSAGTPQWAALIAIVDQQRVAQNTPTLDGPSQLLPALYQTYTNASPTGTNPFTDIVSGVSDTFVTNSIGQHIDTGKANLSAGPGYDLVTGLGTPRAQYLVPYLVAYGVTPGKPTPSTGLATPGRMPRATTIGTSPATGPRSIP